jgi:hypothetical protein
VSGHTTDAFVHHFGLGFRLVDSRTLRVGTDEPAALVEAVRGG